MMDGHFSVHILCILPSEGTPYLGEVELRTSHSTTACSLLMAYTHTQMTVTMPHMSSVCGHLYSYMLKTPLNNTSERLNIP